MRLAYANAALWSIGNGLTTGTLVYYLILDLGANPLKLSLLLALPALVGLLRLVTPALIRRLGTAKRACLAASLVSYCLLALLPAVIVSPSAGTNSERLTVVIGLICIHQLFESIAYVALLAWLADWVPLRVRGRFFARRNMWQLGVLVPTLLASGFLVDQWRALHGDQPDLALLAYAAPIGLGAAALLASLLPLAWLPPAPARQVTGVEGRKLNASWRTFLHPLGDPVYRRLLAYRAWLSFSNGITQAAQNIYPRQVLLLGLGDLTRMRTGMQLGQFALSPWLGRLVDRFGNRPVLIASQALVAAGLGFYLLADQPGRAWLLWGAFLCWSAYAGINIAVYNLLLKLPPPGEPRSPYVALHEATSSVSYAASTIAGGYLLDRWGASGKTFSDPTRGLVWLFAVGLLMRCLAVLLAAGLKERSELRPSSKD